MPVGEKILNKIFINKCLDNNFSYNFEKQYLKLN